MVKKKYFGTIVPAVTPLNADLTLDTAAVERLFERFRQHSVMPFILGTTGEAPSLPTAVKQMYIRQAGRLKQGGDCLYVGIGTNCLADSIEWAHRAFDEGADVVVATLPSYYPLTEGQMRKYFEQLAGRAGGPLMIYNIPSTTHVSIPLEVINDLSRHPQIVGLKDSERNVDRLQTALRLWSQRSDFSHFLGWIAKADVALTDGTDGLVPSSANFAPGIYKKMEKAAAEADRDTLSRLQLQSNQLGESYQAGRTLGESLAALKLIMQREGLCQPYMMPPL
ncbi:MAG TPA: dihydrodipicolinate synthase family protein [Puia sp.]|nr:dihydrodipicolinate synthase family protein [Puia sp.]